MIALVYDVAIVWSQSFAACMHGIACSVHFIDKAGHSFLLA